MKRHTISVLITSLFAVGGAHLVVGEAHAQSTVLADGSIVSPINNTSPPGSSPHTNSVAGVGTTLGGANSVILGVGAQNIGGTENTTVIGQGALAGQNSTAIGQGASTGFSQNATALGQGAVVDGNGSVAIGQGSVAIGDNVVSFGSVGNERTFQNVKAGTQDTDAVNKGQLDAAIASVSAGTVDTVARAAAATAQTKADTAQATATGAASKADAAQVTAREAQTEAIFANNRAQAAQIAAAVAVDTADAAQVTAKEAQTEAIFANNRAQAAQIAAAVAVDTADTAQATATTAVSKADAAQGTANMARAEAAAAVTYADAVGERTLQSANTYTDAKFDQLNGRLSAIDTRISRVERIANRGVAAAMAMQQAPVAIGPGESSVTAGVGGYRGEAAIAVGIHHVTRKNIMFSAGVATSGGTAAYRLGGAWKF